MKLTPDCPEQNRVSGMLLPGSRSRSIHIMGADEYEGEGDRTAMRPEKRRRLLTGSKVAAGAIIILLGGFVLLGVPLSKPRVSLGDWVLQ